MNRRRKHPRLALVVQAGCVFGVAFVFTWRCSWSQQAPRAAPTRQVDSQRMSAIPTGSGGLLDQRARGATLVEQVRVPNPTPTLMPTPPVPATAIQKSTLSEWTRFLYEHPRLAGSTEMSVRHELEESVSMYKLTSMCVPRGRPTPIVDLSAEIKIDDRAVSVQGWGCDTTAEEGLANRICDCFLSHLPESIHLTLSGSVADEDLVPFDGMLSLRVWL